MGSGSALGVRKASVLRAVVRDHIRTAEPVGSGSLAGRYRLRVSPATIRGDMAALEEMGYLVQPHTSAGRVPTDLGYRFFVDTLSQLPRVSPAQRRAITASIRERAADLDDVMRATAQLLSRMTHYAALTLPPAAESHRVVRADLVTLGAGALLLVVNGAGRVDKRVLDLPEGADAEAVRRVSDRLEPLGGRSYAASRAGVLVLARASPGRDRSLLRAVAEALGELDREPAAEHAFVGGVANIAVAFEHQEALRRVVEALDEEAAILGFLRGLAAEQPGLAVRIGRENPLAAMREASVVVAPYGAGGRTPGVVALIGPTRMEYPSAMSAVAAVARRVSAVVEALAG